METFFPRAAILVLTAVLGMLFLKGIADPYKSNQNETSICYQKRACENIQALDLDKPNVCYELEKKVIPDICKP